ncbi:MAG: sugar ABC transporter ATP-binding protein [Clostridiales bacterium]|nr:sugar ABC transporter ATP-binding protein [Clostridiales bacterium]
MEKQPILRAMRINKNFGPTRALIDVDFVLFPGEVHGLIGENGSGKSTFSSIVAGAQSADSGTFELKGEPYLPRNMVDAQNHGVGMIVQEQGTIGSIDVASNIFTGRLEEFSKFGFVNMKQMTARAQQILNDIGAADIDASAPTLSLNFEDRKIVEMARVMVADPDILIVDETTTALAMKGRKILFDLIERFRSSDKAVIFISHDLGELMNVCDRVTVLRDGQVIDTLSGDEITEESMRRLMVGREFEDHYFRSDFICSYDEEVVLDAQQITYASFTNLNLQLHKGEILGICGLSDCGMHELGKVLFGIERSLTGKVILPRDGTEIKNPHIAVKKGMGYLSKDRDRESIILNASILDNVELPSMQLLKNAVGYISSKSERKLAQEQIDVLKIKCRGPKQRLTELSGGNKQKVVFSKWLGCDSDILILDCATRGIDVGVKAAIYRLLEQIKERGKSVILISEELPEMIGMSDRMLVMKDGKITAEFRRSKDLSEEDIIRYMI